MFEETLSLLSDRGCEEGRGTHRGKRLELVLGEVQLLQALDVAQLLGQRLKAIGLDAEEPPKKNHK